MFFTKNLNKLLLIGAVLPSITEVASMQSEDFIDKYGRIVKESNIICSDPIDEYRPLTPKSKYDKACELISSDGNLDKIIGIRLMIDAALNDDNSDAIEHLRTACKISNDIKCYSSSQLFDIFKEVLELA